MKQFDFTTNNTQYLYARSLCKKMQAIEFEPQAGDGVIHIPDEYKEQAGGQVKVILLADDSSCEKFHNPLSAISINTKNFKFDREEANARYRV